MYRRQALGLMREYFADERFIAHTHNVLDRAEAIFEGEKIDDGFYRCTVTLGSIFHDIGIPEALRVHASMEAPYQEKEGPWVARHLLSGISVRPDILERVCYIVGHHHTMERIDGVDFKIIWEADFLVNVREGNLDIKPEDVPAEGRKNIETATGTRLLAELIKEL